MATEIRLHIGAVKKSWTVCNIQYMLRHVNVYTVRIIAESICGLSTTLIDGTGTKFSNNEFCYMYM